MSRPGQAPALQVLSSCEMFGWRRASGLRPYLERTPESVRQPVIAPGQARRTNPRQVTCKVRVTLPLRSFRGGRECRSLLWRGWRRKLLFDRLVKLPVAYGTTQKVAVDEEAGRARQSKLLTLGDVLLHPARLLTCVEAFIEACGIELDPSIQQVRTACSGTRRRETPRIFLAHPRSAPLRLPSWRRGAPARESP
jgi:hypothetical protein